MKPSPCLSPLHIRCKDGIYRSVPCGHCEACLVNKGRYLTTRLQEYLKNYSYQFMVTLTFNDEHLPLAIYDDANNVLYHQFDCDYNGVVYSRSCDDCSDGDFNWLRGQIDKFGGLPVLSHRLLIEFKKRFRYYYGKLLKKLHYDEKDIFIYACGEYGPTTFRPHYHLLFGTNCTFSTDLFRECINRAWSVQDRVGKRVVHTSLGFIDCQRVTVGSCESYCAQYLSCNTHLPFILKYGAFRPFSSGSSRVDGLLSRYQQDNLQKVFDFPAFEIRTVQRGKSVLRPVPVCYKNRYYPLIPKFSDFFPYELYSLYGVYKVFSESSTAFERFESSLDREIDYSKLLHYKQPFIGVDKYELPLTILQLGIIYACFIDSHGDFINDFFIRKRNFLRLWYVSRKVCINAAKLGISVSAYVDRIIKYYSDYELYRLRRFYLFQQELVDDTVHPLDSKYLFTLYTSTSENDCDVFYYAKLFGAYSSIRLEDIPLQRAYASLCRSILNDTTKTKKRNDFFVSRGLKRPKYFSILPKRINKFLNI